MAKLTKDQQRWLDHIATNNGVARGMTLGRGRPHDRRVLKSLIERNQIKPLYDRSDPAQNEYALLGPEDKHGLALFVATDGRVEGALHYGTPVTRFTDAEWSIPGADSARQNGIDTAWALYPDDETKREWMEWSVTRSTLAAILGQSENP